MNVSADFLIDLKFARSSSRKIGSFPVSLFSSAIALSAFALFRAAK